MKTMYDENLNSSFDETQIIDDSKEKEIFNKYKNNHQIKLSSEDILLALAKKQEEELLSTNSKNSKKKKVIFGFIGTGLGGGIVALSLGLGIFFTSKTSNIKPTPEQIQTQYKAVVSEEMLTFSNFNSNKNIQSINNRSKIKYLNNIKLERDFSNNESNIDQQTFESLVDEYEGIESGVFNTFDLNNYQTQIEKGDYEYNNEKFEYKMTVAHQNLTESITYFYNQSEYSQNHQSKIKLDGVYLLGQETIYRAEFINETEISSDEKEIEMKGKFISYDATVSSKIFSIDKESEQETSETEESYTYSEFSSEEDYQRERPDYSIQFSYEQENNREKEIDITVTRLDREFQFSRIKNDTTNKKLTFEYDFENETHDIEYSGKVELDYSDSTKRIYTELNKNFKTERN